MIFGKKLLFINFILFGVLFALSASAKGCPTASPLGVGCSSGQHYCGGSCRVMATSCPTWEPSPTCANGLTCTNCNAADACGVCSSCANTTTHTLCGTYPNKICQANTTPPSNCKTYNQCTSVCSVCDDGYYLSGNQCIQAVLKLGPDSVSGATAVVQSTNNTLMYLGGSGVSIGTSTIPGATALNVVGAAMFSENLSMIHNKSIKVDNANGNTTLLIGNYGDGQGFGYGASTTRTASLAVEGDVKANRLCIKEDCRAEWSDIQGTSYWTASDANIHNNNSGNVGIGTTTPNSRLFVRGLGSASTTSALNIQNSSGVSSLFVRDDGYVGIGDNEPYNKLSIIGDITASGAAKIAGNGSFMGNLGIGSLPTQTWARYLDLSGIGNAAYLSRTASVTAALIASETGTPSGTGYDFGYAGKQAVLGTLSNQPLNFITNGGSKMFLSADGKLGIGTTSPVEMLDVNGGTRIGTINNATGDIVTVSSSGVIQKRTTEEVRDDIAAAKEINSLYYVEGNTTGTAGTWTGNIDGLDAYYDGLTIAYKIGIAGASGLTLDINNLGAKAVRRNTAALTTHLPVGTVVVLTYTTISSTGYWVWADYDADSGYYYLRWNYANVIAGAETTRYKIIMEGHDGRFYPLTIGNSTSANGKTVSSAKFKMNGQVLWYVSTTVINENAPFTATNLYSDYYSTVANYTFNQISTWTAGKAVYLVGTIDNDGYFVLDGAGSTGTGFLSQVLPTDDDGKIYILLGYMTNTTSGFKLTPDRIAYHYKDGKIRLYETMSGTGDSNYITKWTGSTALGSSNIYNDGSSVGINTTTPEAALEINGNAIASPPTNSKHLATKGYVDGAVATTSNSLWKLNSNDLYASSTNWNVGIGTTSPLAKLDVDGSLSVRGSVAFSGPLYINGGSRLLMVDNAGNVSATTTQAGVSMPAGTNGQTLRYGTSAWEATSTIFVKDGGNVGIGTNNPSSTLHVVGVTTLSNDLSMVHNKSIQLNDASADTVLLIGNYGDGQSFVYGTSTLRTASLAVEGDVKANRLCIKEDCRAEWSDIQGTSYWTASDANIHNNNSGNVGIGTTTPNSRLFVRGLGSASTTSALNIQNSSGVSSLFVRDDGYVGIGDNEPYNKLSIIGDITASGAAKIAGNGSFMGNLGIGSLPTQTWARYIDLSGSGNAAYLSRTASVTAAIIASETGTPAGTGYNFTHSGQQMVLGTVTNQPLNFITNGGSKMFLSADGKLGIGTTTPGEKLSVQGNIALPMTSASEGMVKLAGQRYLHSFGNTNNLFVGYQAGNTSLTTAVENTFIGSQAGKNLTTGSYNVAIGRGAGASLTSGAMNTLIGRQTGGNITTGGGNTLVGLGAGEAWKGNNAVVMGHYAGRWNSLGTDNVIIGTSANYSGNSNSQTVAIGNSALNSLVNGSNNTALGNQADYYAPSAGASSLTAGTNLGIGMYYYRVTYVLSTGETNSAGLTTIVTTSGNQAVNLSSIPVYSGPLVCSARKIYRTKVGAYGNGPYYLVATINDNSTTTYTDTTPDASLVTVLSDNANSVMIGYGAKALKSNQLILGSNQSEIYLGKGVYSANPGTISLLATGGMGTNNAGANLVIAGGQGTGSAAGGNITFQTAAAGSSGSLFNSLIDRVTITNNGNVGIGTTSPLAKLDVDGSLSVRGSVAFSGPLYINGGSRLLMVDNAGNVSATTTQAGVSMPAGTNGQTLRYGTSAWEATSTIFVKDGGNVGVGTTTPTAKLSIIGAGTGTGVVFRTAGSTNSPGITVLDSGKIGNRFSLPVALFQTDTLADAQYADDGSKPTWRLSYSGTPVIDLSMGNSYQAMISNPYSGGSIGGLQFRTGGLGTTFTRMTISQTGNVGIGTASPGTTLHVANLASNNAAYQNLQYISDNSSVESSGESYDVTKPSFGLAFRRQWIGRTFTNLAGIYGFGSSGWRGGLLFKTKNNTTANGEPDILAMMISPAGNVGIGTTSPGARLDVNGLIKMRGTQISQPEDVINRGYLNSALSAFNSNTNLWKLSGNKIYASSTDWNIGIGTTNPGTAKLAVMGGNVGIGTTNPGSYRLSVNGKIYVEGSDRDTTSSGRLMYTWKGLELHANQSNSGESTAIDFTNNNGYLSRIVGYGAGTGNGGHLLFFTSPDHTYASLAERMIITNTGNVGIGTTSPGYVLDVNGSARFNGTVKVATPSAANDAVTKSYLDSALINSTSSNAYLLKAGDSMSGDLDMDGHKIVGVNKLTVTTIDPLYDIDGVKYSTYAPSVVGGVKEEYIGRGEIRQCGKDYCSWRLDFSSQEKGSDLWVWRQIIDFQPENVDVLMTAYGRPASLSYEIEDNQIIFYADRPTRFSYRLVGSRFDWRKWPTLAVDQSEEAGLIIK